MGAPDMIVNGTAAGGPPIGGTGTTNTIPRWTGASTLGDSVITQSGTLIGVNKAIPTSTIDVDGLQTNSSGTSANTPTGTLRLNFAGQPTPGYGASIVFSQQWFAGSPTNYVAVGQITGVKTAAGGSFGGGVALWYNNGGNGLVEGMRITDTGNVGIGTTSPGALLDVNTGTAAGSYVTSTRLSQTGTAANSGQRILFHNSAQAWDQGAIGSLREGANNNFALTFFTSIAGTNTERARIDSAGNFAVGRVPTAGTIFETQGDQVTFRDAAGNVRFRFEAANSLVNVSIGAGWGLKLPATPGNADTQTLDCYAEGTWAPTLTGFGGTTPTATIARYTRVGRLVTVHVLLTATGGNQFSSTAATTLLTLPSGMTPAADAAGSTSNSVIGADGPCVAYTNGNLYVPTFALRTANTILTVTYSV